MYLTAITPILNVSDIPASIAWFERLGWNRCFTHNQGGMIKDNADRNEHSPATFASVGAGECEVFLCHDGQGSRGGPRPQLINAPKTDDTGGVWMTWWLRTPAEVDAAYQLALRQGATAPAPPVTEPWGVREFRLIHPDGHTFRVSAHAGRRE